MGWLINWCYMLVIMYPSTNFPCFHNAIHITGPCPVTILTDNRNPRGAYCVFVEEYVPSYIKFQFIVPELQTRWHSNINIAYATLQSLYIFRRPFTVPALYLSNWLDGPIWLIKYTNQLLSAQHCKAITAHFKYTQVMYNMVIFFQILTIL